MASAILPTIRRVISARAGRRGVGSSPFSGPSGLEDLIERNCRHARRFAAGLTAGGCQILNEVVLNQVLVSLGAQKGPGA